MPLVCRQNEQLPGFNAAREAPHGHAAPPAQNAVNQVVAEGIIPGDQKILRGAHHNPRAARLDVQPIQINRGRRDKENVVRTAADNIVLQVVIILIVLHIIT